MQHFSPRHHADGSTPATPHTGQHTTQVDEDMTKDGQPLPAGHFAGDGHDRSNDDKASS